MRISTKGFFMLAAGLLLAIGPAHAGTMQVQPKKTLEEVVAGLSAKGYRVREIEIDDGRFEATVIDAENVVREAVIDGTTGEIRRIKRKR